MKFIQIAFPILMILLPAAVVSLIPANPNAKTDLPRARRLLLGMWLVSFGCLALWFTLAPILINTLGPMVAWLGWLLFFPMWFGFGVPIIRAKNPDWVSTPPPDIQVRAASLAPRQGQPNFSSLARHAPWIIWAALFVTVLFIVDWRVFSTSDEALLARRAWAVSALTVVAFAAFNPLILSIFYGMLKSEPQPLDPAGSAELVNLYATRTRQRAMLFLGLAIAMTIMFGTMAVVMATISRGYWSEQHTPMILGWAGGIAGSVIGLAGGVFGTMSSIQAARINRRLRELTQTSAARA
jgi:hypothetical protein